ncbi:MAG: M1 family metallopeptidase [Armatimonadetes bacterium]|nr:M1 family metallopeptidase [Armatimonadota bacterium]
MAIAIAGWGLSLAPPIARPPLCVPTPPPAAAPEQPLDRAGVAAPTATPATTSPTAAVETSRLNAGQFRLTHDLQVRIDPETGRMAGDDRMDVSRIPNDGFVCFRLHPDLNLRDVTLNGERLDVSRRGNKVRVDLRGHENEPARVRVRYDGRIPGPENGPGQLGVYLYDESYWHPNHMGEHGESTLTVTVPREWSATASGVEQSVREGDNFRSYTWRTPWAGSGLTLAAAQYDVTRDEQSGLPVRAFLYPNSDVDANALIRRSRDVVNFFEPLFGPYPYDRLDIVESMSEGANASPGIILFHPTTLRDAETLDDFLSHEVSHNWWAGALAGYTERGLWYEAFAEFSANIFTRGAVDSPIAVRDRHAVLDRWRDVIGANETTPVRDVNSYEPWDEKNLVAYHKGAYVLHMLRDRLGDEAFFKGMRAFVEDNRASFVSWEDAQSAFETASGQDLGGFFSQWLDRGDAPSLALEQVGANAVPGGWSIEGKVRQVQTGAPYDLEVPVVVKTRDGEVHRRNVPVGAREGTFSWTLPAEPESVEVDPEARIFRLRSDSEMWVSSRETPPTTLTWQ